MKISVRYMIMLFGITYSTFCMGQSNSYYLDRYGNIQDEHVYKDQKDEALKAAGQQKDGQYYLFENLTELYNRNDSTVYSYNWILTVDIEKTEKEFQKLNSMIGETFPIKDSRTLNDSLINIDDLKGKPTLINLWFTACPPCIREMPVLNEMKAENNDRFNFLSITMDSKSKVSRFLEKHNFDFNHIVGSKELTTKLGFRHFPMNICLDQEGRIRIIENSVPVKEDDNGISVLCPDKFLKILESLL